MESQVQHYDGEIALIEWVGWLWRLPRTPVRNDIGLPPRYRRPSYDTLQPIFVTRSGSIHSRRCPPCVARSPAPGPECCSASPAPKGARGAVALLSGSMRIGGAFLQRSSLLLRPDLWTFAGPGSGVLLAGSPPVTLLLRATLRVARVSGAAARRPFWPTMYIDDGHVTDKSRELCKVGSDVIDLVLHPRKRDLVLCKNY